MSTTRATKHPRLEDIEFMAAHGEHWDRIAHRLNTSLSALAAWLRRHGHPNLALDAEQAFRDGRRA